MNQDKLLALANVDIDIINPNGTCPRAKGYIDFQDGALTVLDNGDLASPEGMMASGPYGVYGIILAADGGYEIHMP